MNDTTYCYSNSNVLKNKLNIKNQTKLTNAEIELTSERLMKLQQYPINGNFDFNHLCEIHKYIFQDLYDWAGKPRTVNIGKGNIFCLVQHIPNYADSIFNHYYTNCINAKDDMNEFIHVIANNYADLNALHPFREGNGRTQREFTREL